MRRRAFIVGAGAASVWPLTARAEQSGLKRVGVLMGYAERDPEAQSLLRAFVSSLQDLGWSTGRNLRIDIRWTANDADRAQTFARELIALQPDVIVTNTTPPTRAAQRETRTIPLIFAVVSDPVGDGFVNSLAHPGSNLTGFINMEGTMGGKWLQLLKEFDPKIVRAAALFNPDTSPGGGSYFLASFEAAAKSLAITSLATPVRSDADIEAAVAALGHEPGGGLVMMGDSFTFVHRAEVIAQAAGHKVPAVYFHPSFAAEGALLCYGPDFTDIFRRAATYVDRILKGATPSDLPVQVPTKFELALNLKTAKALGLEVPQTLLATADEVIE